MKALVGILSILLLVFVIRFLFGAEMVMAFGGILHHPFDCICHPVFLTYLQNVQTADEPKNNLCRFQCLCRNLARCNDNRRRHG